MKANPKTALKNTCVNLAVCCFLAACGDDPENDPGGAADNEDVHTDDPWDDTARVDRVALLRARLESALAAHAASGGREEKKVAASEAIAALSALRSELCVDPDGKGEYDALERRVEGEIEAP